MSHRKCNFFLNYCLFLMMIPYINAITTQGFYTVVQNSHAMSENGLLVRLPSQMDCAAGCTRFVGCSGASFNLKEGACEILFGNLTNGTTVQQSTEWTRLILNRKIISSDKSQRRLEFVSETTTTESTTDSGCSTPFTRLLDNCYYIVEAKMSVTYLGAQDVCATYSAQLASLETYAEFKAIQTELLRIFPVIQPMTQYGWLLGAYLNNVNKFEWLSGQLLTTGTFDWDDGEPDGGQNCMSTAPPEFKYHDVPCGLFEQQFICKHLPV